ncbi:hypothetical protein [Gracilimonas sp.]|uniref:hypothetical protein n=1 Tax=Gracilimonas sp. TaxID=1974203 RepID=UPI0028729378|nr:hypothetical protein [Gracilimonas sp.]
MKPDIQVGAINFWSIIIVGILLWGSCDTDEPTHTDTIEVSGGKNMFETSGSELSGINRVWYYRPSTVGDSLRLVMVLHGMGRNGEDYLDSWIPFADENRFLVVAPEFSDEQIIGFVGSLSTGGFEYRYATGNVVSWFSWNLPEKDWYFSSVEQLFDTFRRSDSRVMDRYVLFGHSAGGQFVHRMVLFNPDARFDLAIAANSGWYTLPDSEQNYPYGLSGAPNSQDRLNRSLQRPLVIFLGTEDTPDQGGFRTRPEAMKQGESRPQRGKHFFDFAQRVASERGLPLSWQLKYAEGIGHSYRDMAEASILLIQERGLIPNE